jgi:hypothetical protein
MSVCLCVRVESMLRPSHHEPSVLRVLTEEEKDEDNEEN